MRLTFSQSQANETVLLDVMSCDLGNSNNALDKPAALKISENCIFKLHTQEILDAVHPPRLKIHNVLGHSIYPCLHTECGKGRTQTGPLRRTSLNSLRQFQEPIC
jgi:hypothetical protein